MAAVAEDAPVLTNELVAESVTRVVAILEDGTLFDSGVVTEQTSTKCAILAIICSSSTSIVNINKCYWYFGDKCHIAKYSRGDGGGWAAGSAKWQSHHTSSSGGCKYSYLGSCHTDDTVTMVVSKNSYQCNKVSAVSQDALFSIRSDVTECRFAR